MARWSKDQRAFSFADRDTGVQMLSCSHTFRDDPFGLGGAPLHSVKSHCASAHRH